MRTRLKVAISLGVLLVLVLLLPWQEVRAAWGRLSFHVWLAVYLLFLGGHCLGVLKWRMMVNAARLNLNLVGAVRCYMAGLFANLCLPGIVGGDILRIILAGKATGRPEAAVLGGLADRMIDVMSLGLLLGIGGLLAGNDLVGWDYQLLALLLLVALGVGLISLPLILNRPLNSWPVKYRRRLGRTLVALRRQWRQPVVTLRALMISLLIQGGFVWLNAWIGYSIGLDLPLSAWFLVWPLAKVASLMPISLGGLGVRDATLAALVVPFGVSAAQGFVVSLIWQTVVIAGGLTGGAVWWSLSLTNRRVRQENYQVLLDLSANK